MKASVLAGALLLPIAASALAQVAPAVRAGQSPRRRRSPPRPRAQRRGGMGSDLGKFTESAFFGFDRRGVAYVGDTSIGPVAKITPPQR